MGATGWSYFVPYEEDICAALQRLREDVFARAITQSLKIWLNQWMGGRGQEIYRAGQSPGTVTGDQGGPSGFGKGDDEVTLGQPQRAARNAGITSRLTIGHHWPE